MDHAHVWVSLQRDEDGYPPFDEEQVPAEDLAGGRFRAAGAPLFAPGPPDLVERVERWDATFQATLDADYPPDSAFPTPADEAAFWAEGATLARELSQGLAADVELVRH